jgi:uncharacterized membrane protein YbhN (UPF0104 family)
MIFPGGIGVREGVLVYAFGIFLPLPVAMVVSVVSRGIIILSQLVFALVSWIFARL